MHTLALWRWRVTDPATGRRHVTRHRMTEADALATDPTATRVEGLRELRQVPDGPDEFEHASKLSGKAP